MVFIEINIISFGIMNINNCPSPWDIRYFQEVAFTQNVSRAAERLGVGQPALSLSIKRLEDTFGVKLFYRRHRGLVLTEAGQRLLRESNLLLSNWESLIKKTSRAHEELVGRFSIGCHPSVGSYMLGEFYKKIYGQYPGIDIELVHGLSRVICEGVISGDVDFGMVVNPIKHSDLIIHKMAQDEVCFWQKPNALPDVLICNPQLTQTQSLLKKIKSQKQFKKMIFSDNLEFIASMAKAGAGTAILPSRVARAFSDELEVNKKLPIYRDEIAFIYRCDLIKTASSKAIIEVAKSLRSI